MKRNLSYFYANTRSDRVSSTSIAVCSGRAIGQNSFKGRATAKGINRRGQIWRALRPLCRSKRKRPDHQIARLPDRVRAELLDGAGVDDSTGGSLHIAAQARAGGRDGDVATGPAGRARAGASADEPLRPRLTHGVYE